MTTIVRGPRPPEIEQLLERRRRSGADRFDEVWDGRYVVAPDPHSNHGEVASEVRGLLKPLARRLGLRAVLTFNLGGPGDYRIPDAGLLPGPAGVWHDTAVLVVDWQERSVRCFAMQEKQAERDRSEVLGLTTAAVVDAIEWPPLATDLG